MPELLVVMGCMSLSTAILLPVLATARSHAQRLLCMTNQREIVNGVSLFAADNEGRYPNPVATSRRGATWSWSEPTMMTAYSSNVSASRSIRGCFPGKHRSMAAYLHKYIADASIMFCPSAPSKYKYLQECWDDGDDWDNPETPADPRDMVWGTYCFYWNYVGYLEGDIGPFVGPLGSFYRRDRSKLLVSDYFGYDYWRSPDAYGSCERIKGAAVTGGTSASSAYWSISGEEDNATLELLKVELHAGYMDGHVERYRPTEVVPMKVSWTPDGSEAFPSWRDKGTFYLPRNGVH